MKVFVCKLDNPDNEYEWWIKDIEIKTLDDLEKLTGFFGDYLYAEIYQIDKKDDPILVRYARDCISAMHLCFVRDIIMRLFGRLDEAGLGNQ